MVVDSILFHTSAVWVMNWASMSTLFNASVSSYLSTSGLALQHFYFIACFYFCFFYIYSRFFFFSSYSFKALAFVSSLIFIDSFIFYKIELCKVLLSVFPYIDSQQFLLPSSTLTPNKLNQLSNPLLFLSLK